MMVSIYYYIYIDRYDIYIYNIDITWVLCNHEHHPSLNPSDPVFLDLHQLQASLDSRGGCSPSLY